MSIRIRTMTDSDVKFALALSMREGWNQTQHDWQRLLDFGSGGCFVATDDGRPVGTITTTRYRHQLAWIGMMLVNQDDRRRGIATQLMRHALDFLRKSRMGCIKLDATPDGQPVYERLGFQVEWELQRWERAGDNYPVATSPLRLSTRIRELDLQAFGTDRLAWLEQLAATSRVVEADSGFALLRSGQRAAYLGPFVGMDSTTAHKIANSIVSSHDGHMIWDIPNANHPAIKLAETLGFKPVRRLLRMWIGDQNHAGNALLQFGIGAPETG